MTYREIKGQIKALYTAINQRENSDNKYSTSGRMKTDNDVLKALEAQLVSSTVILDRTDTITVMKFIKTIAAEATDASDFEDCGIYFDTEQSKSLLWWLAELLPLPKGITIKTALNDLQVAIDMVPDGVRCVIDHFNGFAIVEIDDQHLVEVISPSIALIISLTEYIIANCDHNHMAAAKPPSKAPGM